jgi:transcriptional regulator with XRE-family HTH domain
MDLREVFGRNLRRVRQQRELSQEALAAEAGIDRTYVSALERGVYSASVDMIEKLAKVLAIEAHVLLMRERHEHGARPQKTPRRLA